MSRRAFLAAAGAASLATAAGGSLVACSSTSPATASGTRVPLAAVRRLWVEHTDPILGRCRYVAETASGRVARPLLIARPGDEFDATIVNRLPQPTTVHFHGLVLPQSQDGAGFDVIAPGGSRRLRFRIHNRGGLYWFHPHPHGLTAEQVHAGLVGLLCVTDGDDAALDAALQLATSNRIIAALSDARVSNGAVLPYAPNADDCLHGWIGNRGLVNGALDAAFTVAPGWVRLQLLNACNARGLLLAFEADGAPLPFALLGTDGGLLSAPVELERVFLHPAERVDVALRAEPGRAIQALSAAFDPRAHIDAGTTVPQRHAMRADAPPLAQAAVCVDAGAPSPWPRDGSPLPLFRLQAGAGPAARPVALPARLSALPAATPAVDWPARRWRLDLDATHGFVLNNTPYRRDEEAFTVARSAREVWELRNSPISMAHPMHVHGPGFRVLRRQGTYGAARALAVHGAGRLATDLGLKDTVTVWPNETVWLVPDFALPATADFAGRQRYLFHCHNLEHEDGMMMRNFVVA